MIKNAIEYLVNYCGNLNRNEVVVIIYDETTTSFIRLFYEIVKRKTNYIQMFELAKSKIHGIEPPDHVAKAMYEADLIICLTQTSLAHTKARMQATDYNARFLSLPDYSKDVLQSEAVFLDYKSKLNSMNVVEDKMSRGENLVVKSNAGTSISMDIKGRRANSCPGFVNQKYRLGSPPDAEVNIAPVEEHSKGVIIVDGSITCKEIGLLNSSVALNIDNGKITSFNSTNKKYQTILEQLFNCAGPKAYYLAECGIGFNDKAQLSGNMLIDEGTYGCIHFGFGSNYTINGKNKVAFHLDFVMKFATLLVDDETLIKEGVIL